MEPAPQPSLSRLSFLAGFGFGAFIGGALALLAVALLQEPESEPRVVVVEPTVTATATDSESTPSPRTEELPRTTAALDVHIGPGDGFAVIGLISRGESVEPVGRSDDLEWVAVRFPPGSAALGWIPVSGLDGELGLDNLSVLLPTPLPRTIPDFTPLVPGSGADGTPQADETGTPGAPGDLGPPDLVVTSVTLLPDRRIAAVVSNRGLGTVVGNAIFVQFRNLGILSEVVRTEVDAFGPGETITVTTSQFRLTEDEQIQVIVDPFGGITESNESNNQTQVLLELPKTPTPSASPPGGVG